MERATSENSCWRPGLRLMRKGGAQTCVVCGNWECHDDLTCCLACRQKLESGAAGFSASDVKYKWVYHYRCATCKREGWFAGRSRVYCSTRCANAQVGARRRDNPLKLAYACAWCGELRVSVEGMPRQFCRMDCQKRFAADVAYDPSTPRPPELGPAFRKKWRSLESWQDQQDLAREIRIRTAQAIVDREERREQAGDVDPQETMTFGEFMKLENARRDRGWAVMTGPAAKARALRILEDEQDAAPAEKEADAPDEFQGEPPEEDDSF